jgi:hypothetical protein
MSTNKKKNLLSYEHGTNGAHAGSNDFVNSITSPNPTASTTTAATATSATSTNNDEDNEELTSSIPPPMIVIKAEQSEQVSNYLRVSYRIQNAQVFSSFTRNKTHIFELMRVIK